MRSLSQVAPSVLELELEESLFYKPHVLKCMLEAWCIEKLTLSESLWPVVETLQSMKDSGELILRVGLCIKVISNPNVFPQLLLHEIVL